MSDKGFDIDTEAVREAARKLRNLRGDFDEIANYTAEADPDWWAWGGPGLVMSQQYEYSADRIRAILGKLGPGFEGILCRIESACADYASADDSASGEIGDAGEGTHQPGTADV